MIRRGLYRLYHYVFFKERSVFAKFTRLVLYFVVASVILTVYQVLGVLPALVTTVFLFIFCKILIAACRLHHDRKRRLIFSRAQKVCVFYPTKTHEIESSLIWNALTDNLDDYGITHLLSPTNQVVEVDHELSPTGNDTSRAHSAQNGGDIDKDKDKELEKKLVLPDHISSRPKRN